MKQRLFHSSLVAVVLLVLSSVNVYSCGLWDGMDKSGRAIGGWLICRGYPLFVVQYMDSAHRLFTMNIVINYLIYIILGMGLVSIWERARKSYMSKSG